jgi:serine/threonine protein kinase
MALSETKLGAYEIVGPLGAGGMGEVYRATDTRLKRQVAIKLLPSGLAVDPDRLARFQREAELLASLNHPNIAAVYGLEDSNGVKALVMELVEGPTLADRIKHGPIPIDEALPIARQIAAALEAAHEQGIIHRDLKPANIKVRDDGTVKVLDFGLAKLTEAGGGRAGSGSDAPTMTSPVLMTGMGIILGTAAYMSPEQARGRIVDKRTDVWAFGAVLYEMLTAARAFEGEDIAETIASVVKSTPNWTALPADLPPHIVTLIQRCLEKDRNARIGDMAVARFLMSDNTTFSIVPTSTVTAAASGETSAVSSVTVGRTRKRPESRSGRRVPSWLFVVGGLLLAVYFASRPDREAPQVAYLQMSVSPADMLVNSQASVRPSRTAIAISPDGKTIAFSAIKGAGPEPQLYVRTLDRADATAIPGTDGAIAPIFSPDGRSIAFWTGNTLKKVPAGGGPAATICTAAIPAWGMSWGEDDTIYFADRGGIFKVSASGGTPTQVTKRDNEKGERHLLPQIMPGGKVLLFTSILNTDAWDTSNTIAFNLQTNESRVLIPQAADARYVDTGHLLFLKSGTLMAVPFNVSSQQVTGAPVAVIDNVMQAINAPNGGDESGAGQFTVSPSGTLLYVTGGISPNLMRSLVWVDRNGKTPPLPAGVAGPYLYPRISPDGRRIAVEVKRGMSRSTDLWIYDVLRGAATRVTFNGSNAPVWSPDSRRLAHQTDKIYTINTDGSQSETFTYTDKGSPSSWSGAANAIASLQYHTSADGQRTSRVWILPTAGQDHQPKLFLESPFRLLHAEFSPDGRWIAYGSTESGTDEVVYVQPYPGPGEKIRISPAGGVEPLWNPNGKELFYRTGTADAEEFYVVPIRSLSPFQADAPRLLFKTKPGEYDSTAPLRGWDVSPDGQRFLLLRAVESRDKPISAINIVQHWTDELKRLTAKPR